MFTLKIRWTRHENGDLADESDLFIQCDQVVAHGWVNSDDEMKSWPTGTFQDYRHCVKESSTNTGTDTKLNGRLIAVEKGEKTTWYLATSAWLLGPDGKTIEHLTAS